MPSTGISEAILGKPAALAAPKDLRAYLQKLNRARSETRL